MHPASDTRDLPAASHPASEPVWTPQWTNQGLNQLGRAFLTRLDPTPLAAPRLLIYSSDMAQHLGMSPAWLASDAAAQLLTGNRIAPGSQPYATVYSGHQFGVWAGQLGDGRAILLGEVADAQQPNQGWELQLKGAGPTPYSRRGDGRAVLRSSIREFLCSEAMHALGIPTTRALSLTASPSPVYREEAETAAVVCRAAPSFIRFGHFEHFAARGQEDELRQLADYVIDRYYPACRSATGSPAAGSPYAALLRTVAERTADLLAHWQAVGFCHGVMNTDNMSILGLTIDYGPFQFLDTFDPGHICNHSDTQGRYAFRQQPQVAYWNLFCLGQALHPLIGEEDATVAAIEAYRPRFAAAFAALMRRKLGLPAWQATAAAADDPSNPVVAALLQLLADQQVDYPIFWTRLSAAAASGRYDGVRDLFISPTGFDAWLLTYQELLTQENTAPDADLMQKSNPRFVLRNHLGELAIRAARTGDASVLQQLQAVLATPFDAHPAHSAWEGFPPDWASSISISCSS